MKRNKENIRNIYKNNKERKNEERKNEVRNIDIPKYANIYFISTIILLIAVFLVATFSIADGKFPYGNSKDKEIKESISGNGESSLTKKESGINDEFLKEDRFVIKQKNIGKSKENKVIKIIKNKIIQINLIAEENYIGFNGKKLKSYTYNGLSPGPIIRADVGDTINATLVNKLKEKTTIHWHGLQVPNDMDGVPGVTQEGVNPGESFTYTFKVNQAGTYWYHPHFNTAEQVGRGLYGILIVEDKNDEIKYDKENVLILDDIRIGKDGQIARFGNMMDTHMAGRYGNMYFINGKENYDIYAKEGSLLKLRLINTANARIFKFAIEDHMFVVLGNDIGRIEKPYETDSVILSPGERAEIILLLDKKDKEKFDILNLAGRYPAKIGTLNYIRGNFESSANDYEKRDNGNENYNREKYYNSLIKERMNINLPDWSDKLDLEPDIVFELYSSRTGDGFKWTINGNYYPEKPDIQNMEEGKFYKLRYISKQRMIHPMHLHGQKFIILARNGVPVKDTMYRDTALVYPGESVDIGLIAEGKGSWVNHCHILEHAEAGMLGIVNVA